MKNLNEIFLNLSIKERKKIHIILCERSLNKWNEYVSKHKNIHYTESVCGTNQKLDIKLPRDAFNSVKNGTNVMNIEQQYSEPITAMQDEDLNLPEGIMFAYYSIYNLFRKYSCDNDVDDWLIVNQALSAEDSQIRTEDLFLKLINQIKK